VPGLPQVVGERPHARSEPLYVVVQHDFSHPCLLELLIQ